MSKTSSVLSGTPQFSECQVDTKKLWIKGAGWRGKALGRLYFKSRSEVSGSFTDQLPASSSPFSKSFFLQEIREARSTLILSGATPQARERQGCYSGRCNLIFKGNPLSTSKTTQIETLKYLLCLKDRIQCFTHFISHLILITVVLRRKHYAHLTDGETGAQIPGVK